MKKKHYLLVIAFLGLCIFGFSTAQVKQNYSQASTNETRANSPVQWETIKDMSNGTQFDSNGLWVIIEETTTTKTANVFTKHGLRSGNDLTVDYWAYTFSKVSGEVVLDGLNSITISQYFQGTNTGTNVKYLPPADVFEVYTDTEAKEKGLEPFREGHIGIIFGEETSYKVPWGKGFITFGAKNPS